MNKLQIYTYQRAVEEISFNQRAKRRQANKYPLQLDLKLKFQSLLRVDFITLIKTWVNLENFLLIMCALILSRSFVLRELLPFPFAFIAAFGFRDKKRLIMLSIFAVIGSFAVMTGFALWTNVIVIVILAAVINYIAIPKDKAWWGTPLLTMSIILICKSSLMLVGEISLYNEMVIIFEAFLAGVVTLVFMVASNALYERKNLKNYSFEEITSFIVLGLGMVIGFDGVSLLGLSISSIICRVGILLAAILWGSGGGTMAGVMCGIIPAISSNLFTQNLGMYAISGLLAGLFKNMGRLGVIIGFMLGNLAISLFATDISSIITGMWETAIACLAFFFLPASLQERMQVESLGFAGDLKKNKMKMVDSYLQENAKNSMENLALVFSELSSTFAEKESCNMKNQETAYLNYLYAEINNQFCYHCSRYESCWGQDFYATSQEVLDIFALAEQNGGVLYEEDPPDFIRRCLYGKEMAHAINYLFDNVRTNEYWKQRLENSRQLISRQLTGLSRVIKNLAVGIDEKGYEDLAYREKLLKDCQRLNKEIIELTPIKSSDGQMYLKVVTPSCKGQNDCEKEIAAVFSSLSGDRMKVCEKKCPSIIGRGNCEFTLARSYNYRIETGAAQVGKETICGDSFTIAALKEGQQLIALSDGMGVGQDAYYQSQSAVRLLESLLNCGYDKEMALETINSVLLLRSTAESFTTLDMVMIDLYTAEADFIKVASAPSFIKRGKKIEVVTSNSLPIGVFKSLDISNEKKVLYPGDMVIMVSDGILEFGRGKADESWFIDFLQSLDESNPQTAAELIISQALKFSLDKPADDMTAIVIQIDFSW